MMVYISLVHVLAVMSLPYLFSSNWKTLLFAFALWPVTGAGITVGVHRLWAHRSYEAHWTVRTVLMLCNSMANQGSIFQWTRDHRVHHKHSETVADPHNATRGFFFAHMGWLLVKKDPRVIAAGRTLSFDDLLADPVVMFQKATDPWFALFMCFIVPGLVTRHLLGDTFTAGFMVPGALRYVYVLHCTWCVNSLAHMYGQKPYDPHASTSENGFVTFLAFGEGWHNWHHKYPYDYAASEYGTIEGKWNPSKDVIDALAKVGLVKNRKRATGAWAIAKARMEREGLSTTGEKQFVKQRAE